MRVKEEAESPTRGSVPLAYPRLSVPTWDDVAVTSAAEPPSGDVSGARDPPPEAIEPRGEVEEEESVDIFSCFDSRTGKR